MTLLELAPSLAESSAPRGPRIAGRVLGVLVVVFLVFDGVFKLIQPAPVVEAFAALALPLELAAPIGALLLVCTALYVVPRTAVLGAVLLTGFLGGAVATHYRVGSPLGTHVLFGVYVGVVMWAGLALRYPALLEAAFARPGRLPAGTPGQD